MKKTTRNYIWVLIANILLIGGIAILWEKRLEASGPTDPVYRGEFSHIKTEKEPKNLPKASYLKNFGTSTDIQEIKGQWTILNLWATWCAPCVTELPSLEKLSQYYQSQNLKVLAISIDNAKNVPELKEQIARARLSKNTLVQHWDDKGEISDTFWPETLPTTYLITPEGKIIAKLEGDADWFSDDAKALVDSLLKASQ
jgi:thiol-disulfide isomerase/thioredoxin